MPILERLQSWPTVLPDFFIHSRFLADIEGAALSEESFKSS